MSSRTLMALHRAAIHGQVSHVIGTKPALAPYEVVGSAPDAVMAQFTPVLHARSRRRNASRPRASTMIAPLTISCRDRSMLRMLNPLLMTPMVRAPRTDRWTDPRPPN